MSETTIEETAENSDIIKYRNSDETPDISIILPTRNDEGSVSECIDRAVSAAKELGMTVEIIVSDSSKDRTPEIAAEKGAIVVAPDREGYGYANLMALEHARGGIIVMGDASGAYDFGELPKLIRPISDGDVDLVLGSRMKGEIKPGAMSLIRQMGNPILTHFLNVFYRGDFSDAFSSFRAIKRDAVSQLELQSTGMEFHIELIIEALDKDLHIMQVPVTYHARLGEASLTSFSDGWQILNFMAINIPSYRSDLIKSIQNVILGLLLADAGIIIFDITLPVIGRYIIFWVLPVLVVIFYMSLVAEEIQPQSKHPRNLELSTNDQQ